MKVQIVAVECQFRGRQAAEMKWADSSRENYCWFCLCVPFHLTSAWTIWRSGGERNNNNKSCWAGGRLAFLQSPRHFVQGATAGGRMGWRTGRHQARLRWHGQRQGQHTAGDYCTDFAFFFYSPVSGTARCDCDINKLGEEWRRRLFLISRPSNSPFEVQQPKKEKEEMLDVLRLRPGSA